MKPQSAATPEKPWPSWAKGYLEALRQVPNMTAAAKIAGVDRVTVWRWTQRDEAFAVAASEAREEALDNLERIIFERATVGTPSKKTVTKKYPGRDAEGNAVTVTETTVTEEQHISDVFAMFYLKRYRPEFREAYRVEHGGSSTPIRVRAERERTPERLEELLTIAAEIGWTPPPPD